MHGQAENSFCRVLGYRKIACFIFEIFEGHLHMQGFGIINGCGNLMILKFLQHPGSMGFILCQKRILSPDALVLFGDMRSKE